MEIKPGKYRTRDSREAVVLEVFEGMAFGRVRNANVKSLWLEYGWSLSGSYSGGAQEGVSDLIAPWEEPKPRLRVWRNINSDAFNYGAISILPEGEVIDPHPNWESVPELDALFEKGTE